MSEAPAWCIPATEAERRRAISRGNSIPDWKKARAVALRREGLTYQVISERLGVHPLTVLRACARAGLLAPRLCVWCGRKVRGNPTVAPVAVCPECKPRWRGTLQVAGRVR